MAGVVVVAFGWEPKKIHVENNEMMNRVIHIVYVWIEQIFLACTGYRREIEHNLQITLFTQQMIVYSPSQYQLIFYRLFSTLAFPNR